MYKKGDVVLVFIPLKINKFYSYIIDKEGIKLEKGDIVEVSVRNKVYLGVVIDKAEPNHNASFTLKPIIALTSSSIKFDSKLIDFILWVSKYNLISIGNVLKMALYSPSFLEKSYKQNTYINNLSYNPVKLNSYQELALKEIKDNLFKKPIVLQGIPGSGKTEVYYNLLNEIISSNKQVLIMVPEVGLSISNTNSFKERFNAIPAIWHSEINKADKKRIYEGVNNGKIKIVIGARSSLFLPFKNLGLIVVDEEHDSSYKQEEGNIYNARDMAVVRAKIENIPIILASATPSLETYLNIKNNKYIKVEIKKRFNNKDMPAPIVVKLNNKELAKGGLISNTLEEKINNHLAKNQQVLIFLNKRGYASSIVCKTCHNSIMCPNCSVALNFHKHNNLCICHYCGYLLSFNKVRCLNCNTNDNLVALGVGIEKIQEEVKEKFSNANTILVSSDNLNTKKKLENALKDISKNKYNIIIGTQIIAKGYNFENLTLVTILEGDFVNVLDLKANERAWQLLYQVAGRSGRLEKSGEVYIQSYNENSSFLNYLKKLDYNGFLDHELKERKIAKYPPFFKMASIIVSSKNDAKAKNFCNLLNKLKPVNNTVDVMGPIQSPIFYLKGNYRYRFIVKGPNLLQTYINKWLQDIKTPFDVNIKIDIDPVSII